VLNISFGSPFLQSHIEQWEVHVILPEGAEEIEWATPNFDVDSESTSTRVTYLDTKGRPMVILRKTNVVRHHNQAVLVAYRFSPTLLIRKPLSLTAAILVFFTVCFVVQRASLTISPPKPTITAPTRRTGRLGLLVSQAVELDGLLRANYRSGRKPDAEDTEAFKNVLDALQKEPSFHQVAVEIELAHSKLRGLGKKGKAESFDTVGEELDELMRELMRR